MHTHKALTSSYLWLISTTDYTYNAANRLVSMKVGTAAASTFTYDANGNQLSGRNGAGATATNSYNLLNRLVSSGTNEYAYRPDGLRESKKVGSATTYHSWDMGNIVADKTGSSVTGYVRGLGLALYKSGGTTNYYIKNVHGDVVQMRTGSSAPAATYTYTAFGETRSSATHANPFLYGGEYYDKETAGYYLRARYYVPAMGRFTQQDTHWNPGNAIYGSNGNL